LIWDIEALGYIVYVIFNDVSEDGMGSGEPGSI
jgi:hypothetical protein